MNPRFAAAALALLASGCATLPPPVLPEDWPARRATLQALDRWTLNGRIAVAAGEEGFSGGLDWSQQGPRADIGLSGPLGGTAMRIRVEGNQPVVSVNGETYDGEEARELIERNFGPGRRLPVEEMRYWLVGAPAPGAPDDESLGVDFRLASLSQSGWTVRYDRYQAVGALALPARIEMKTEGLRLRIVVSGWQLAP